jgi:XTP/dITP diphosphohydrolase
MEMVVATRNRKKLDEIRRILEGIDVGLHMLDEYPDCPEVEETGRTFEENAVKKAREVASHTGRTALADDSGLEVDALAGAPGVYSARFAALDGTGGEVSDKTNTDRVLSKLGRIPDTERGARFVCVIALARPGGDVRTFEGTVEGRIGRTPVGESGFGYDPVFYPEGHGRTFAQMKPEEKDGMSHRGKALRMLRQYLAGKAGKDAF